MLIGVVILVLKTLIAVVVLSLRRWLVSSLLSLRRWLLSFRSSALSNWRVLESNSTGRLFHHEDGRDIGHLGHHLQADWSFSEYSSHRRSSLQHENPRQRTIHRHRISRWHHHPHRIVRQSLHFTGIYYSVSRLKRWMLNVNFLREVRKSRQTEDRQTRQDKKTNRESLG